MTDTATRVTYVNHGGWVGLAPEAWSVGPLRRFCEITLGKMVAKESTAPVPTRPYLRAAHVQPGGVLVLADVKEMPFSDDEAIKLKLNAGDVVVVEGGAGYGRSAVLRQDLAGWGFQNSINRVRPYVGSGRFTNYALLAAQSSGYFETLINTATIPHLTAEKLADVQIAWPRESVQRQIADYLDTHTAKIDALIGKQERLIETLAERRQSVISHAVTKGLDPNAPMKDSGSVWFPRIPYNWSLTPCGVAANLIQTGPFGSQLHSDDYVSDETPVINPSHIVDGEIVPNDSVTVDDNRVQELSRHRLREGDVIAARRGEMGRAAVVRPSAVGWLCGTGSLIIRLKPEVYVSDYFRLIFSSGENRATLTERSIGATMDNLNADIVARLRLPRPPIEEQRAIIRHLDRETAQIDALSAKAREMIDVLKERRQALISAAVTGKIDVRGLS